MTETRGRRRRACGSGARLHEGGCWTGFLLIAELRSFRSPSLSLSLSLLEIQVGQGLVSRVEARVSIGRCLCRCRTSDGCGTVLLLALSYVSLFVSPSLSVHTAYILHALSLRHCTFTVVPIAHVVGE